MYQENLEKDFRTFFYEKFQASHGDYYGGNQHSLVNHFESGEVRVPVLDVFKLVDEWFNSLKFKNPPEINPIPTDDQENKIQNGVALIAEERKRQIEVENFTPYLDAGRHTSLAAAGGCYALLCWSGSDAKRLWPFDQEWLKAKPCIEETREDIIRRYQKAGALIAAAIDSLQCSTPELLIPKTLKNMITIPDKLKGVAKTQAKTTDNKSIYITWLAHLRAYAIYSEIFGTSQSAKRLEEKGGFGEYELYNFYPEWTNHIIEP